MFRYVFIVKVSRRQSHSASAAVVVELPVGVDVVEVVVVVVAKAHSPDSVAPRTVLFPLPFHTVASMRLLVVMAVFHSNVPRL